ncbi:putative coronin [Histomonas meleagridis]|uniref:putative coronin n=1 Tax=Histomonas meleagridis TaxID=135588 RepID=UPI00355A6E42|nr:putative coronin [Histomonas meleagridis]KAH0803283.1 putative coronin [Histomonas meleagridis]
MTRASLFRHVYGEPSRPIDSYGDVLVHSAQVDSNMLAVNAHYIAIPWQTNGGGALGVLKVGGKGKIGNTCPLFEGHKAPVIDVAFNPFADNVVASASEDSTIRLWKIEESDGKIKPNHNQPLATLTGHGRKAARITFNPLVNGAMASFGMENAIKLWDINKAQCVTTIKGATNNQNFLDIAWSQDGNRVVAPAKDKKIHIYDMRAGNEIVAVPGHQNIKSSHAVFYDKLHYIFTTGFSSRAARQIALRDDRNPEKPLQEEDVDYNAGILFPFIDYDNGVVFTFGRGDTAAKYYELRDDDLKHPIMPLSGTQMQEAIRCVACQPKYCCNTSICEIMPFYVITNSKALLHVPMIVPRRNAECFQDDIYPDTVGPEPSAEFDDWKNGAEVKPKLVNLENFKISDEVADFKVEAEDVEGLKQQLTALNKTIEEQKATIAKLEAEIKQLKGE